ncbi:hypothetical protein C8F04DRAFT_1275247 [Mycena alexandri]|uniref:Uncharacterized protein n=1 Tax=Mycena alexandri TaxID=1745969 RepID=A0AAD6WPE6_9AGAR|nr:hypothetical protein C8F04DRAFT_1275247 [Mycena alexandri]
MLLEYMREKSRARRASASFIHKGKGILSYPRSKRQHTTRAPTPASPRKGRGGRRDGDSGDRERERDGGSRETQVEEEGGAVHRPAQVQVLTQFSTASRRWLRGPRTRRLRRVADGSGRKWSVETDTSSRERGIGYVPQLSSGGLSAPRHSRPPSPPSGPSVPTRPPARDLVSTLYGILCGESSPRVGRSFMESAASVVVGGSVDLLEDGKQREALLVGGWAVEVLLIIVISEMETDDLFFRSNTVTLQTSFLMPLSRARVTQVSPAGAFLTLADRGGRGARHRRLCVCFTSPSAFPAPVFGKSSTAGRATGQRNAPWATTNSSSSSVPTPTYSTSGAEADAGSGGKAGAPLRLSNVVFPELPPSAAARMKAAVNGDRREISWGRSVLG